MPKTTDFWFALALTVFGTAVMVESWRMPRLAELDVHPMSAPGLTPGVIGLVLTVLGAALLLREARRSSSPAKQPERGGARLAITFALCLAFALGLVGRVPFWLATLIFVAAFALIFTRSWPQPRAALVSLALAGITAAAITYLFQEIFLVHLP